MFPIICVLAETGVALWVGSMAPKGKRELKPQTTDEVIDLYYLYIYVYACVSVYIYMIYVFVCMHMYIHVCMCIHVYL